MARILLIEDSPTEAAVMTQLLERNGHQVTTSASAAGLLVQMPTAKPCPRSASTASTASPLLAHQAEEGEGEEQ